MGTAKQVDGISIVAYVNGVAVDSEGRKVPGAPAAPKDTDPSEQPGALGAPSSEERMGLAIAKAIADPKGTLAAAAKPKAAPKAPESNIEPRVGERPTITGETAEPKTGEPAERAASAEKAELPKISDLKDHLAGIETASEVKALQKTDKRAGAQRHYKARLAELKGE